MYKEAEGCLKFLVIKDFYKLGSACMCFKPDELMDCNSVTIQCQLLAKSPLQVVSLGGPNALEIYGEYAPYTFYTDPQDMINICLSGEAPGEYLPGMKKLKEKELGNI